MASHNQEPLDVLIQRITNPLSQTYDPQLVYTFCERIKRDQDGAVAATRLLAYRVQSPQEREAMLALDLLDTCARTGGARFQAELGKFRFLNELIKLLSPRYLGARTPQRVKQRVADLLLLWSRQIPHETKIQEAFTLLQKQGLLDLHGLDPHRAPTPPLPSTERPKNPIFEDSQKAALLKRLLQSTNPDDIQAANRLIKTMVKQDEERSERVSRRVTELETVHSNLRLLEEMMDNYSPETTSSEEMELMAELCTSCQQLRGKLDTLAAETDDQDSALAELVSASEQIGATIARHRELSSRSAPLTLLQLESPQEARPPEAPDRGHSQDMLQRQLERLGGAAPVPLFCEPNSLEISLHGPAGNRPRRDVTVYVITALNRTGRSVTQYTLQAVCDKMSVHLRFMLSYSMDDDIITEMAETTLTGQS
ncbi:ADP-ribosylation factor-binding protein GGA1 [Amphibalanus amphitrite]|uniref:ADP-ribosylation factor-binding protein GGA1 n=1 Tax=Amphibalanus amphitrite TaxID=1232801 RepID=A0A6A4X290_AMPAM|nr:ADP-ribosylation factor-binding protein GGA1 [Amphibalanus amphitrite]KAF0312334.1 ADP-ribosylation factor-binding protein GGA1 [Amphibalanus amphitrite]